MLVSSKCSKAFFTGDLELLFKVTSGYIGFQFTIIDHSSIIKIDLFIILQTDAHQHDFWWVINQWHWLTFQGHRKLKSQIASFQSFNTSIGSCIWSFISALDLLFNVTSSHVGSSILNEHFSTIQDICFNIYRLSHTSMKFDEIIHQQHWPTFQGYRPPSWILICS